MEGINLRDACHVCDKGRPDRSSRSDQVTVRNRLPHQFLGDDIHDSESIGNYGIQFLLKTRFNNIRKFIPVDLMSLVITDLRKHLIGIRDHRRTLVRPHWAEPLHPVRDQVGVGDDNFPCLLLSQIFEFLKHLLRRPEVQRRLLLTVFKVRHQDLSVDRILRIQEMNVAGRDDRFSVFFTESDDPAVVILQVLYGLRLIFQIPLLVVFGHSQEHVVAERLDLKIIIEIHQLLEFFPCSASLDRLEQFASLAGRADDQAFSVRAQETARQHGTAVEHVFQVRLGDAAVQVYAACLILRQKNTMIVMQMADLVRARSAVFIYLIQPEDLPVMKHVQELEEDRCSALCIVHCPVVMPQRNVQRFCNRVQLEPAQVRKQTSGNCHCIRIGEIMRNAETVTVFFNETDIEEYIVSDQSSTVTKFHERRKDLVDCVRILHHRIIDRRQLLDPERDRDLRIHEFREPSGNLSVFDSDCTDLNDPVVDR